MKYIYNIFLLLSLIGITVSLSSCCADNECAEEDIYGKTIIKQTDTVVTKNTTIVRGPYSVQIGSYANKKNADAFYSEAKGEFKGLAVMKQTPDGLYRILVGEYKTLEEAQNMLTDIKRKGYTDAFVRDDYGPIK